MDRLADLHSHFLEELDVDEVWLVTIRSMREKILLEPQNERHYASSQLTYYQNVFSSPSRS